MRSSHPSPSSTAAAGLPVRHKEVARADLIHQAFLKHFFLIAAAKVAIHPEALARLQKEAPSPELASRQEKDFTYEYPDSSRPLLSGMQTRAIIFVRVLTILNGNTHVRPAVSSHATSPKRQYNCPFELCTAMSTPCLNQFVVPHSQIARLATRFEISN